MLQGTPSGSCAGSWGLLTAGSTPGGGRPQRELNALPGVTGSGQRSGSKRCYGAPRIHAELKARGLRISKRSVVKLMRENGIRPPRRRRRAPITTDSRHSHAIAPNLLDRNFEAVAPDAVWLADISYIPTDEGWLYLAAVKDLATMEIVGWSMSERLKSVLCEEALKMAIRSRRLPMGLIHHSDRGVQYACGDYRSPLKILLFRASSI